MDGAEGDKTFLPHWNIRNNMGEARLRANLWTEMAASSDTSLAWDVCISSSPLQ